MRGRHPHAPRQDGPARARQAQPRALLRGGADLAARRGGHSRATRPHGAGLRPGRGAPTPRRPEEGQATDRRPAGHEHDLGRGRRAAPRADGRHRPAEDLGRVHPGDEPRGALEAGGGVHGLQLGASARPLPLRALRALPRDLLQAGRAAVGDPVRAARGRPRVERPARRARAPRGARAQPERGRAVARPPQRAVPQRDRGDRPSRARGDKRQRGRRPRARDARAAGRRVAGSLEPGQEDRRAARLRGAQGLEHRRAARPSDAWGWHRFTIFNSLRDVEPSVGLVLQDGPLYPGGGGG